MASDEFHLDSLRTQLGTGCHFRERLLRRVGDLVELSHEMCVFTWSMVFEGYRCWGHFQKLFL